MELKTVKLPHMGTSWYFNEDDEILCLAFKDKKAKKPCLLVSTNTEVGMRTHLSKRKRQSTKPIPIGEYNMRMNGCDRADQMAGYYNIFGRKTYKWWKKLFYWIIELAQINSLVLFNKTRPFGPQLPNQKKATCDLRTFKKTLVHQLEALAVSLMTPEELQRAKPNPRGGDNSLNERYT